MFKKIIGAKVVGILSLASLAFVLGGWFWAIHDLKSVAGTPLILHFEDIEGITAVGSVANLDAIGAFGALAVIMDFFIALELDARDRFLGKFAAVAALIFSILLFIGFAAIINVN